MKVTNRLIFILLSTFIITGLNSCKEEQFCNCHCIGVVVDGIGMTIINIDEDVELEDCWPTAEEASFACEFEVIQNYTLDGSNDIDCNCLALSP